MTKKITMLCVVWAMACLAPPLWAGGIVNKQNLSVEYLRTFSRNAAMDAADTVVYNPAGVMALENGGYLNAGIFYAAKDYANTIDGTKYDTDEPSIVPGLFAVYKKDRWALIGAFTIPGGGGEVDFGDGNARTTALGNGLIVSANARLDQAEAGGLLPLPAVNFYYSTLSSQSLKANSIYYGYTLGGAFAVTDWLSVAAGVRYVDAIKEFEGAVTFSAADSPVGTVPGVNDDVTGRVKIEETADGWGGFLGVNMMLNDAFNIGIRYETATKLDFESSVKRDNLGITPAIGFADGSKTREDLPGLIGMGLGCQITPKLKADLSYTHYLEKNADWEGRLEDEGDSWDLAIAFEYAFTPELRVSLGYMMTETGIDADEMLPEAPELDARTVCGGVAWMPLDNLTLNFALMRAFYDSETTSDGVKLEKDVFGLGFGLEWKFM